MLNTPNKLEFREHSTLAVVGFDFGGGEQATYKTLWATCVGLGVQRLGWDFVGASSLGFRVEGLWFGLQETTCVRIFPL